VKVQILQMQVGNTLSEPTQISPVNLMVTLVRFIQNEVKVSCECPRSRACVSDGFEFF